MPPVIRASELVRRYGQLVAVDGVSFEVEPGEAFGFLGPNGAGKTTTISILCTLLSPTSGSAEVNGFDVVAHRDAVRASIGIVFQDPSLDINLTARENLRFHADVYGVPRGEAEARMGALLEMVDLTERADKPVMTFSGGMRRRLELARGLLHRPIVLFLDEPTIGLDPQSRKQMWSYILDLAREEGITLFLTTHYLDEAEHCGRIAIMDHGRIIALDTPAGLKRSVGGDALTLRTDDDAAAATFLREELALEPTSISDGLHVAVPDGDAAIPRILGALPVAVRSVTMSRPTLDDVFIELTGRHIREEEGSAGDMLRAHMAARMRSGGRV
ncbi:MAG TPA: ATP-binding cassette domain-containing protein [Actinomycetota bacterium]|nr:ATP-binding cassette domain-containing protein [Actinomycetota bacterium]